MTGDANLTTRPLSILLVEDYDGEIVARRSLKWRVAAEPVIAPRAFRGPGGLQPARRTSADRIEADRPAYEYADNP
jgi:hypothetical protein